MTGTRVAAIVRSATVGLAFAAGFALSGAAAAPAFPGPPWISIEIPANPHDPESRNAFLLVRVYHHDRAAAFPVTGTAEGWVNGERRSLKVEMTATSKPGVYAVTRQWPTDGTWVLVFTLQAGSEGATAVVELDSRGAVASVQVPTRTEGRWTIPRKVTAEEIDGILQARLALASGRD